MKGEAAPAGMFGPSRVVIVDDHPLLREALRGLLESEQELELVGEASNGEEAVAICRSLNPDLVLMDARMPKKDGLEATREIKEQHPRTVVLMLTAAEDSACLLEALKAGASGYLLKDATYEQIVEAIRKVLAGESPLNQDVGMRLLLCLVEETSGAEKPAEPSSPSTPVSFVTESESLILQSLSPRERSVLKLLARGWSNRKISDKLFISVSTVKKHVSHLILKLGVSDRVQAAVKAVNLGLLGEQESEERT